jgi:hypothetical protein
LTPFFLVRPYTSAWLSSSKGWKAKTFLFLVGIRIYIYP